MEWSKNRPNEDGHYWYVQELYKDNELEKRYGPSIVHVKIEEDRVDGEFDMWVDHIGTDDGDYIKSRKNDLTIERVTPREAISGWDSEATALKKLDDKVTRKWVYWFKPIYEAEFDPSNKTIDPYEVVHQDGMLSIEKALSAVHHHCDLGVQITQDGRIWLCINGEAYIRFKPMTKETYNTLIGGNNVR